jgi:hypothetical protein
MENSLIESDLSRGSRVRSAFTDDITHFRCQNASELIRIFYLDWTELVHYGINLTSDQIVSLHVCSTARPSHFTRT